MVIYSQQNKQDLITQDFQSNQAVGKPIGNKEKLGDFVLCLLASGVGLKMRKNGFCLNE